MNKSQIITKIQSLQKEFNITEFAEYYFDNSIVYAELGNVISLIESIDSDNINVISYLDGFDIDNFSINFTDLSVKILNQILSDCLFIKTLIEF
jgi:hypothetical protein